MDEKDGRIFDTGQKYNNAGKDGCGGFISKVKGRRGREEQE